MLVSTVHFCSLSTDPKFLTWLRGVAQGVFDELVAHSRQSRGCAENAKKMLWVLDQLVRRLGLEEELTGFLREHYPHVITSPRESTRRSTPVFDHYDPSLLTLPRRLVVDSEEQARRFLRDKVGEYVVAEGRVYVEYLPAELAAAAGQIPDGNWQTRAWRRRNSDQGVAHGGAGEVGGGAG